MTSAVRASTVTSDSRALRPNAPQTEVIAGLANDGSARRVATASLDYALAHDMSVSFVHVVSDEAQRQGADDVGDTTFAAMLDAMRGHGRLRCAFEVVRGSAEHVLVKRSRLAGLLVIGSDSSSPSASVAEYCRVNAGCSVLTVDAVGAGRRTTSVTTSTGEVS